MHNIQRVDHHDFHGWHVCLKRAGKRYEVYIKDGDDRGAALARAQRWRDQMARTLPPPRKFKQRYVLNKTGVIGVHLAKQRTRKGTRARHYCATWIDEEGRPRKRSFSLTRYGEAQARARAIRARKQALEQLLTPGRPSLRRTHRS